MDVHHLEYFLAVRDNGSIHAAANALGITQPTISQAIKALEREMGVGLFHRIGRGMALTSAGHALAGPARQVLREIAAAEGSVHEHEEAYRGTLQMAVFPALAAGLVSELVARVRRRLPRVTISVEEIRDEASATTLLRDGHVEIVAIHLATDEPNRNEHGPDFADLGLRILPLGQQEFWLSAPPEYARLVPDHDPIGWHEVPDIPMVFVPRGGSHAGEIERQLARAGKSYVPAVSVEQRETLLPLVLAGVGATFLEQSVAEHAREAGAVVRSLEPSMSRPFGFVYAPESLSTAGRVLIDLAEQIAPA